MDAKFSGQVTFKETAIIIKQVLFFIYAFILNLLKCSNDLPICCGEAPGCQHPFVSGL
jgi:hypothetical protein